jgi:hypothetical protein
MARPYSQDLRERVVGSVASGRTCRATAALFGVSAASVVKWSQGWWASGSAAAKPMEGWRPLRLTGERAWLWARIAEKPDLTLASAGVGLYGALVVKPNDAPWVFSRCRVSVLAKAQCRTIRGELASGREGSRYTLVFGRSAWTSTMMQSCASAAKLRDGRPIL